MPDPKPLAVRDKINAGHYDPTMPYIVDPASWRVEIHMLRAKFKVDAIREVGLADHRKADRAFVMAWERGHSAGFHEVLGELEGLARLLLED